MIILVNSKISQSNIVVSLGKPEYSYYFLLREFLPALEQIGTLIQISSLDEVDTLYDQYAAAGEDDIFLSQFVVLGEFDGGEQVGDAGESQQIELIDEIGVEARVD